MNSMLTAPQEVPLESKLAFLRQPGSFPESTYRVEAIETHMSWVFLTVDFAYKLKKPVFYETLDFRTVEARQFYCLEEIRLNRRLAADVYLDVIPLVIDAQGHLHLGGAGQITDWLVKMRRLPADSTLDYAIKSGSATEEDMARVATRLADFYRQCAPVQIDPAAYRDRLQHAIDETSSALSTPDYHLDTHQISRISGLQHTLLAQQAGLFYARIASGKIIEGHGDLRPEHVYLGPAVTIIDCLEFSADLRIVDCADELGFLALECERLGSARLGATLLDAYQQRSGDVIDDKLLHFYKSFRACIRAKLAIWHLNEEKFRYSPEWRRRAIGYLHLAEQHAQSFA